MLSTIEQNNAAALDEACEYLERTFGPFHGAGLVLWLDDAGTPRFEDRNDGSQWIVKRGPRGGRLIHVPAFA